MEIVITYGTFDLFHYGHYHLLKRAKALGDYLIVGVSTDEMCLQKGKKTSLCLAERMEIVSNLRFVDQVIVETSLEQKVYDVRKYGASIFVLGSDYQEVFPMMREYSELIEMNCRVVFLPRTPDISTTILKERINGKKELENS